MSITVVLVLRLLGLLLILRTVPEEISRHDWSSPEIWVHLSVGLLKSLESGEDEVTLGLSLTSGLGVAILDTGNLEDFLRSLSSDQSSSSWSWD